jgi:hypothetical protein
LADRRRILLSYRMSRGEDLTSSGRKFTVTGVDQASGDLSGVLCKIQQMLTSGKVSEK